MLLVLRWIPWFAIGMLSYRVWAGERSWRQQVPYAALVLAALAAGTWRPGVPAPLLGGLAVAAGACAPPLGPVMRTVWSELLRDPALLRRGYSLDTVAEGVEDEGQAIFLRAAGCDRMQGYWFARPMPAKEMEAMLWAGASHHLGELTAADVMKAARG